MKRWLEVLLFIIGLAVAYFGIYRGAVLVLASKARLDEARKQLADWQARKDLVNSLTQKIKSSTLKEELEIAFPERPSTHQFLMDIQQCAHTSKVTLSSFAPQTGEGVRTSPAEVSSVSSRIGSFSVGLQIEGTYSAVEKFVGCLEKLKRVSQIKQISLTPQQEGGIRASVQLVVYYLGSQYD